jgi:hypothetical protein
VSGLFFHDRRIVADHIAQILLRHGCRAFGLKRNSEEKLEENFS